MSKDARNNELDRSLAVQAQIDRLVALLSQERYGEGGPPRNTTFAEIERYGHQTGQQVARALDAYLTAQHAARFQGEEPCPECGEECRLKESPHELPLQTLDGAVRLHEPTCNCPTCRRDFFPGEGPAGN